MVPETARMVPGQPGVRLVMRPAAPRRGSAAAARGRRVSSAEVVSVAIAPATITSSALGQRRRHAEVLLDDEQAHPLAGEVLDRLDQLSTIVGARPSDGSSMTSSFGLVSSARPIASICCSPPESDVPLTFLRSASRGKSS